MIRVCLCDDDKNILKKYFKKISELTKMYHKFVEIEQYESGESLIFELEDDPNKYDILVIDIIMKKINGIETTEILRKCGFKGIIIFLTSSKEFALDSFKVEPLNYILKDEENDRFEKIFIDAISQVEKKSGKNIIITNKKTNKILNIDTIIYMEIMNKKIFIHKFSGEIEEFGCTLDYIYDRVKDFGFIRCHKSYLVNSKYIVSFNKLECKLKTDITVPIGRKYSNEFKEKYLLNEFNNVLI